MGDSNHAPGLFLPLGIHVLLLVVSDRLGFTIEHDFSERIFHPTGTSITGSDEEDHCA